MNIETAVHREERQGRGKQSASIGELGVVISPDERRETLLKTLDDLFATGPRDKAT
jgi:hypothetical protein